MTRYRLVLVEDHELLRAGLASLLALEPDLEVVGQAGDGFAALQCVRDTQPDLVLMDVNMPVCGGLEATLLIHAAYPAVKILMLSVSDDDATLLEALRAGASGYVLKSASSSSLTQAIRQVMVGGAVLSPKQTATVMRAYKRVVAQVTNAASAQDAVELTYREREVLTLIAAGATNREIAKQLSVSQATIKSHVRSILRSLNASTRHEAAQLAVRRGIVGEHRSE